MLCIYFPEFNFKISFHFTSQTLQPLASLHYASQTKRKHYGGVIEMKAYLAHFTIFIKLNGRVQNIFSLGQRLVIPLGHELNGPWI